MSEGECQLKNSKHSDADTNTNPVDTLAQDTNTELLHTYVKNTNTDLYESLARDTNTDYLQTLAKDTNTDPIDVRKVQFSHTTTNTDEEVLATFTVKQVKSVDVGTDTRDVIISTTISIEDDDCSDSKSLHSVSSHLDEEFYDPIRNGNEVINNISNQAHCLEQDQPHNRTPILNVESKSKSIKTTKHVEKELKSLKPTLSRCKLSRSLFPHGGVQKNPSNRMVNRIKKNMKDESCKKHVSSPSKLANGLLEDSHIKTHLKLEKEAQKKFVEEPSEASLFKKDTFGSKSILSKASNASNEHCKSHEFNKTIDPFHTKQGFDGKIKVSGVPNFQSKLSDEHCKSHQLESSKLESEMLSIKTPRSQSPWTKATPVLKVNKTKTTIKKRKFKQVKRPTPPSQSPQSTPLESPQTPRCIRDRDSTPPIARRYLNPKGLKPIKANFCKPNAKHPQPWIMPSPNVHYDDIELDSLPPTPRYCSRDKKPLQRHAQKYSPRPQSTTSITKSNDSSSQPCFGMPCVDAAKPKKIVTKTRIEHKKIADFIVQDLPPLKLSKKSKSPHQSLPSTSPLSCSPFTTPKKIHALPQTLKSYEPQLLQAKLNQVVKTNNFDDNKSLTGNKSFANENKETFEEIGSNDSMSKHIETSPRISNLHAKFLKFERTKSDSNSNPYACKYHNYPAKIQDHVPPPIIIERSTSQIENANNEKKSKCNCCGKKMASKKVQKEHEKSAIDGNKENLITITEGQKDGTKIIKVKGMKFNVAITNGKQGSKVLRKMRILMLRSKTSPTKDKSKYLREIQNGAQNEKKTSCWCFGGSKSKVSKAKTNGKISSTTESNNICKNNEVSRIHLLEENVESAASILSMDNIQNENDTK